MKTAIAVALLICSFNCQAQSDGPSVGSPAPQVIFQTALNKKVDANFYKGKILVLDFWATWCAPCIAAFPHFNTLSKKYGSNEMLFAAITDETSTTAGLFFNRTKKELDALKLCDTSKKTLDQFHIMFIPHCVVIGKDNMMKWSGSTIDLTADILDKIIAGEPLNQSKPQIVTRKQADINKAKPKPAFSFSITRSDTTGGRRAGSSAMQDRYSHYIDLTISQTSIASCLEKITGFSQFTRLKTNDSLKLRQLIDLDFYAGQDTTLFNSYRNTLLHNNARSNFIVKLMGEAMKFDATVTAKKLTYYELIITDTARLHKFKSMQTHHSSFDDDNLPDFEIVGYKLKDITTNLEASFGKIITTKIEDNSRYDLSLDVSNITTLNKTLAFHGLKLIEVTDDVEFLNVNFR